MKNQNDESKLSHVLTIHLSHGLSNLPRMDMVSTTDQIQSKSMAPGEHGGTHSLHHRWPCCSYRRSTFPVLSVAAGATARAGGSRCDAAGYSGASRWAGEGDTRRTRPERSCGGSARKDR